MARPWIMIKDINGIEYAYLYKTIKEEGEFKNKMIRYLGRLDLLMEALDSVLKKRENRPIPRRKRKRKSV